jgi:acylphosphatase
MGRVRIRVFVSGLVQGVFFRSGARRVALQKGVRGWVRNLRDGRVEAVFEGEEVDVKAIVEWCKKGPPGAVVERVEVIHEPVNEQLFSFEVAY